MNTGHLRKAYSDDVSREIRLQGEEEEKVVKCDCCGLEEECTVEYINKVKTSYSGKWVCGLCAEVVTERCRKHSPVGNNGMQEALDWQRGFHETFISTTRLNPKLDFARAMSDIAKRSSQNRFKSKIARSNSCDPRVGPDLRKMV